MEQKVVVEFPVRILRDAILKAREVKARGYCAIDVFVRWVDGWRGRVEKCDVKQGNDAIEKAGGLDVYRIYYEAPNKAISEGDVLCELLLMVVKSRRVGLEDVLIKAV